MIKDLNIYGQAADDLIDGSLIDIEDDEPCYEENW